MLVRQIEKTGHVAFAYVPYKSGSEVAVRLAGGHVAANVNNPQENVGQSWADIPTCKESGLPIERYQMRRGSQTDAFLSGTELTDYIAADERWLRGQFAEDGWLAN